MRSHTTRTWTERARVMVRKLFSERVCQTWKVPPLPQHTPCHHRWWQQKTYNTSYRDGRRNSNTSLRAYAPSSWLQRHAACTWIISRETVAHARGPKSAAFRTCNKASRASSIDATPRSSSTPLRIAMRARDEHALHAVGSTVQTSSRLRLRISRQPIRANGIDARQQDHHDNRDHRYNERPTHDDDKGNTLRPWVDRPQGNRGFNNNGPNRYQNGGEPQQGSRFNQNRNSELHRPPLRG